MVYLERLIGIVLGDSKYEAPQPINDVSEANNQVTHNALIYPILYCTDNGRSEIVMDMECIEIASNKSLQLRIVQPEHGGRSCNCWGVRELILTTGSNNSDDIVLHTNDR